MKILEISQTRQNDNKKIYSVEIKNQQIVYVAYSKNINQLYIEENDYGNMVYDENGNALGNADINETYAKEIIQFVSDYIAEKLRKMTQFERELYGYKGKFWQRDAERRLEKIRKSVKNGEITIGQLPQAVKACGL